MNKDTIEKVFRSVGVVPVDRDNISGREVFIGDGYSEPPHAAYVGRGAISRGQFPNGCYVTWWFVTKGEDKLEIGAPLFCEPTHDLDKADDPSTRQRFRINAAKHAAGRYIREKKF